MASSSLLTFHYISINFVSS
uniref:Uncharacterized protein n=1 Tax=Arundo donax TaxID=35708 RepID=A0A0A9C5K6_ARUDO